jgi:hypothetical protein
MYHHEISPALDRGDCYEWESQSITAFNELLISWNSSRPEQGHYSVQVSVKNEAWSPWMPYAEWGQAHQRSFIWKDVQQNVEIYQDAVALKQGHPGTAFKVRVCAEEGATLEGLRSLHVCASQGADIYDTAFQADTESIALEVNGVSQMALDDPRAHRLCSPSSTTAVLHYLLQDPSIHPLDFAEASWDGGFDIFGNWVLNVAEASHCSQDSGLVCWVERYSSFQPILEGLYAGFPSVISIRGPITGSAQPYKEGHLLVIIGFDTSTQEVLCMDPAFPTDEDTLVRYDIQDLLRAWERRGRIAYVFRDRNTLPDGV